MSGHNYYSEINLHITWHCKESYPLITPQLEPIVYREIRQRIINTPGVYVHAIGGIETHVHVAVTVPPTLTPSEFIGALKGGSSHDVNKQTPTRDKVLQWQRGYGVVSFATRYLEWVCEYIKNQKEHHQRGTTVDRLERFDEEAPEG